MGVHVRCAVVLAAALLVAGAGCDSADGGDPGSDPLAPLAIAVIQIPDSQDEPSADAEQTLFRPVRLDGTASYDPMDPERGFEHLEFHWRIVSTPPGSLAPLETMDEDDAMAAATREFTPDEAGAYRFELSVTNPDVGLTGEPAQLELTALPLQDMRAGLSWTTPATDLDLHLIAPDGEYWTSGDCYFGNPNPDWGEPDDDADDPVLVQDDDEGGDELNPAHELIGLWQPPWGTYTVVAVYHSDRQTEQTVTPRIEVTVDGAAIVDPLDAPRPLEEGEAWRVLEIEWPDMDVLVLDELTTHEALGGPPIND